MSAQGPDLSQRHWLMSETGTLWVGESGRAFWSHIPQGGQDSVPSWAPQARDRLPRAGWNSGGHQGRLPPACVSSLGRAVHPQLRREWAKAEGGRRLTSQGLGGVCFELSSPRQLLQQTEFWVHCGPHKFCF